MKTVRPEEVIQFCYNTIASIMDYIIRALEVLVQQVFNVASVIYTSSHDAITNYHTSTSSGIEVTLTMCTQCRRVIPSDCEAALKSSGDEEDSDWLSLEQYKSLKPDYNIVLSHGLCPTCFRKVNMDLEVEETMRSPNLFIPKPESLSLSLDGIYTKVDSPSISKVSSPILSHYSHVLLVEDNKFQSKIHQKMIHNAGYQCDVAFSGEEAIQKVKMKPYSLILMDCILKGDYDGWTTTQIIRQLPKNCYLSKEISEVNQNVTIVAVTGLVRDSSLVAKCLNSGMDEVLHKPIAQPVLRKVLFTSLKTCTSKTQHTTNSIPQQNAGLELTSFSL